jgi:flagellar motor switch protein FliN
MMSSDSQSSGFAERLRLALPAALADVCGGAFDGAQATDGPLQPLIETLGPGQHVLLEVDANGRVGRSALLIALHADAATTLFKLEPLTAVPAADSQLRVLAALTESGETLIKAFAPRLLADVVGITLSTAGASLEDADASAAAAVSLVGDEDAAAVLLEVPTPEGQTIMIVVCCTPTLAEALGGDEADASTGDSAAARVAKMAARAGQRTAEPQAQPVMQAARQPVGAAMASQGAGAPSIAPPMPVMAAAPPSAAPALAHPFTFGQLDTGPAAGSSSRNIEPLLDVVLQVRVELGSTEMTVEEVLGLTVGSVVELDRLAGDPVDIVVNNRLLARGEVVVVEENFGVRITEIVSTRSPRNS